MKWNICEENQQIERIYCCAVQPVERQTDRQTVREFSFSCVVFLLRLLATFSLTGIEIISSVSLQSHKHMTKTFPFHHHKTERLQRDVQIKTSHARFIIFFAEIQLGSNNH